MATTFDAPTLDLLRASREVGIAAGAGNRRAVTIWIVVYGEDAFIRSFRGDKAGWYCAAVTSGHAVLHVGDRRIPVSVSRVSVPAAVAAASKAYRVKYATSPYAGQMVRPEVLATTLCLRPQ